MTVHEREHTPDAQHPQLDVVTAHRLVADGCRRAVLRCLRTRTRWPFDELASAVARQQWEYGSDAAPTVPTTVRLQLFHRQLPTLTMAGVIEWDRETGVVRAGVGLEACLELLSRYEAVRR